MADSILLAESYILIHIIYIHNMIALCAFNADRYGAVSVQPAAAAFAGVDWICATDCALRAIHSGARVMLSVRIDYDHEPSFLLVVLPVAYLYTRTSR